jgi:hypothetical protein
MSNEGEKFYMRSRSAVFADISKQGKKFRILVTFESNGLWDVRVLNMIQRDVAWKESNLPTKDQARSRARDWAAGMLGKVELDWKQGAG